jgi:hypothetical protein
MIAAKIIFWICFAVCVYIYFGYPAMLWLISRFRNRPVTAVPIAPAKSCAAIPIRACG